jgi:hypothetical protein
MMCRWRWLAVAWFAGLLAGCGDRDVFGPRLVAGTWITAQPPSEDIVFPDTLVLDSRGAGRIHVQVHAESPQPTWVASAVRHRMDAGTVLIQYCLRYGPYEGDCEPGVWQLRGRLAADGRLYIGPSSMASSVAPRPWARLRR